MRPLKYILAAVVFLAAGLVIAESVSNQAGTIPWWIQSGFYLAPKTTGPGGSGAKVTRSAGGSRDYDAPSIDNEYSHTFSVTLNNNAILGDPCSVGYFAYTDQDPGDGGSESLPTALPSRAQLQCAVTTTGTATVRIHNLAEDGGALDLPDSGYFVRTFSSQ